MILIAAGFHGVSKRVQVALGSPPLGNRAGFHGISKRDEMGGGVLWCVKWARAMQPIFLPRGRAWVGGRETPTGAAQLISWPGGVPVWGRETPTGAAQLILGASGSRRRPYERPRRLARLTANRDL